MVRHKRVLGDRFLKIARIYILFSITLIVSEILTYVIHKAPIFYKFRTEIIILPLFIFYSKIFNKMFINIKKEDIYIMIILLIIIIYLNIHHINMRLHLDFDEYNIIIIKSIFFLLILFDMLVRNYRSYFDMGVFLNKALNIMFVFLVVGFILKIKNYIVQKGIKKSNSNKIVI